MSNDIELVNLEEDLDYELDVEMNVQDEDALLEEDKCDNETELIRKMSMTTVSPIEPLDSPVTPSKPSPTSLYTASVQSDFWNKSISTVANVFQTNPITTTNEVVGPEDTLNKKTDSNQIEEPAIEVMTPVQSHQDVVDDERKDATATDVFQTASVEPTDIDSTSIDPMEMCQSEKLTVTSSSSSTSTSSSSKTIHSKRNRIRKRKFLSRNALLNGFVLSKYRNGAIPNLMSVNTQMPFPRTRFPVLIPVNVPAQATQKKVPFIIEASGNASRKVSVNPDFGGFATRNISNPIRSSFNRQRTTATATSVDLDSIVINKRRSTTSLDTISKSDKRPVDAAPSQLARSTVTAGMSDEEYMMAIAEQKKKREEVLRAKEWKRSVDEGWEFLE